MLSDNLADGHVKVVLILMVFPKSALRCNHTILDRMKEMVRLTKVMVMIILLDFSVGTDEPKRDCGIIPWFLALATLAVAASRSYS